MASLATEIRFTRSTKKKSRGATTPHGSKLYNPTGKMTITRFGKEPIILQNGFYKTSDKQKINDLLRSDEFKRGDIFLETPREIVEAYLSGDTPDKLSREMLDKVDTAGLIKMANVIGYPVQKHGNLPNTIKAMILNEPISNELARIMTEHATESKEIDLLEQLLDVKKVYKAGAWYKFMKGDEKDKEKDLNMGQGDAEAYTWIADHKDLVEQALTTTDNITEE